MNESSGQWTVRLAARAEQDLREVVSWTAEHFGEQQARAYAGTLSAAIRALQGGPAIPTVRSREDIGPGICTLHVARAGRKGRHMLVFRPASDNPRCVELLRVLHDAMDLPGRLTPGDR
ncbi:type II toxin-antitoxin system RelE/ParE family toxin [Thioalkalivibrio sp. ALE16]|uniref:type II toxin-antitoxin system RelE/ParE family toxin n=1 Tax=Thioalkalivibrio sp. ALE16 TaxID=1158172 RepID=UPI0009DBC33C